MKSGRLSGARGERIAANFLERSGYLIWDRNWRVKNGELDLIASIDRTLVFVEVKTRRSFPGTFFPAERAVKRDKQNRIRKLAALYIKQNELKIRRRRIRAFRRDIIAVTVSGFFRRRITHIESAF